MSSVLVTGCNGGIGQAICHEFLSKGWLVFGSDIQTRSSELSKEITFLQADISNIQQINDLAENIQQSSGSLTCLVNNAAVQICKPFHQMEEFEWSSIMDVNLKAPFFLAKHLYPLLKKAKGSIINISSVHAIATSSQIAAYASSKGGLSALTRALAIECATDDIRVNAIQPGAVDTQMLRDGLQRGHIDGDSADALIKILGDKHIVRRVGFPKEIAKLAYFLADSNQAPFMTGHCLTIDGGATIKLSTE